MFSLAQAWNRNNNNKESNTKQNSHKQKNNPKATKLIKQNEQTKPLWKALMGEKAIMASS